MSPQTLQADAGMDYVDLNWISPGISTGLDNYSVYRGTDEAHMEQIANVTVNCTAYHDSNLEKATTYFYRVTAWYGENESVGSNTVVVTTLPPESVQDSTLLGVVAIAISAIAMQLAIVAIWVMLKKGNKRS